MGFEWFRRNWGCCCCSKRVWRVVQTFLRHCTCHLGQKEHAGKPWATTQHPLDFAAAAPDWQAECVPANKWHGLPQDSYLMSWDGKCAELCRRDIPGPHEPACQHSTQAATTTADWRRSDALVVKPSRFLCASFGRLHPFCSYWFQTLVAIVYMLCSWPSCSSWTSCRWNTFSTVFGLPNML